MCKQGALFRIFSKQYYSGSNQSVWKLHFSPTCRQDTVFLQSTDIAWYTHRLWNPCNITRCFPKIKKLTWVKWGDIL